MFASALDRSSLANSSNAYRKIGIETAAASASPHQLVVMLFDGFRDSIVQARGAIQSGRVEAKGRAIGRAVDIINEGLIGALNLEAGGKLARDLHTLYGYVSMRLTHANLHNDLAALEECQRLIDPVSEAWLAIGPQSGARAA